jgi:hypothetical protein
METQFLPHRRLAVIIIIIIIIMANQVVLFG